MPISNAKRDLLFNLTTALPSVIEKNLTEKNIRKFKYRSIEIFSKIAIYLEYCYSELKSDAYVIFHRSNIICKRDRLIHFLCQFCLYLFRNNG